MSSFISRTEHGARIPRVPTCERAVRCYGFTPPLNNSKQNPSSRGLTVWLDVFADPSVVDCVLIFFSRSNICFILIG